MKRLPLFLLLASLLLPDLRAAEDDALSGRRPNIIFILTDDQGYGDTSGHGNPILKTPRLDRLESESATFSDFHVSPTCSPTRSALFTGRHEFKNGVTHTIHERERLTLEAVTLAQVLKTAGYATGIFGKWHLGDEADHQPGRRGFDEVFIHGAGGIGQTYPGSCGDAPGNTYFNPAILHNGTFERTKGFCTDVFFAQATSWIAANKGKKPFFAYLPTNAPHAPYNAKPEDSALYADAVKNKETAGFFGMLRNLDDNVGRLLDRLREWDLERDTLVIFMSDNGSAAGTKVFSAGNRGAKGTAWLGGTRANSFWRWPGYITPGTREALAAHVDFFPTLAQVTGAALDDKTKAQIEGRSLVPLLGNPKADWADRTLFTHVGRWAKGAPPATGKYDNCSVRTTRWHLVSPKGNATKVFWQLFDVKADPGETRDLASEHPDVVKDMAGQYETWWATVVPMMVNENAVGPSENPFKTLYRKQFGER